MSHVFQCRVYYEDTDLAGIVYYANYFKFIERARTEFVREIGIDQTELKSGEGIVFAVQRVEADYIKPAQFDDELSVYTSPVQITAARIILNQVVKRGSEELFRAKVCLVAIGQNGKPTRIPAKLRQTMTNR